MSPNDTYPNMCIASCPGIGELLVEPFDVDSDIMSDNKVTNHRPHALLRCTISQILLLSIRVLYTTYLSQRHPIV